jgi:hypothetical protein
MLTLDTHPPEGRPSPSCPKYAASDNSMLQAVHCTDYLIGKFIDALYKEPDWNNTVVVIMSDHLMMRNDAESFYPADYHRQPALIVLNAGQGARPVRMYHMDVAPTVLDLMGVRTNASFIAGEERVSPDADGSKLVDNPVTDAVLRKALWSRVDEFGLCKKDTLLRWTPDGGFDVGGRDLRMSYLGRAQVGVRDDQALDFFIDSANAKLVIADADRQPGLLSSRGDASVLTIKALPPKQRGKGLLSVDWLARGGATAHLADVPTLQGLTITSPHSSDLIGKIERASAGAKLDFSHEFHATVSPPPELAGDTEVDFTQPGSVAYETGVGWLPPASWGSWAIGPEATFGFKLPHDVCRAGATLQMRVDPYLPPTRPKLETGVWINGTLATTWHFDAKGGYTASVDGVSDKHDVLEVRVPVESDGACRARVDLRFIRAGASPPPFPKAEDPRALQLRVLGMRIVGAANPGK